MLFSYDVISSVPVFTQGAVTAAIVHLYNEESGTGERVRSNKHNRDRAQVARKQSFDSEYDSGVSLSAVSKGSAYLATAFLIGPGTQPAAGFLSLISLTTGGVDILLDYTAGSPSPELVKAQYGLDVTTEVITRSVGNLPGARPVGIGLNVMNHFTDGLTDASE